MLSLEMLGFYDDAPGSQRYPPLFRFFFPDRADFIAFVSDFRSRWALREVVAAFKEQSKFPCEHLASPAIVPGVSWSDHLSFWRAGYSSIMVTDTAFYRYPYYHTELDTPQRLNYPKMAHVVEALAKTVAALAGAGL